MWGLWLMLASAIIGVRSGPIPDFDPCKRDDNGCLTKIAKVIYVASVTGVPSLNVESLDPMYHNEIIGNLATVKYKLTNVTLKGLKDCDISEFSLSLPNNKATSVMDCPLVNMYGNYDIDGQLLSMPIQGNGVFKIKFMRYHIVLDIDLKVIENEAKRYLSYKSFRVSGELREGVDAELSNLFKGQNADLAKTVIKFVNENPKPVSESLQGPVLEVIVKKMIKNFNKILKTKPIDTLHID